MSAILNAGSASAESAKDAGEAPQRKASAAASSDASKSAGAKELFKEGRKLAEKGDYEGACSKFEQSLELEDGAGTRFNLADCYEHLGRTATAYEMFIEVAESSKKQGQTQREGVARSRADVLAGKLSRLLIQVEPQERVVQVRRDGEKLDSTSLGSPVALDPGTYELSASAPGLTEWTSKVKVPPGPGSRSGQRSRSWRKKPEVPPPPQGRSSPSPSPKCSPPAPERETARTGERRLQTGAVILGSVGIAALVAGGTFGLQYQTSNSDARAVCKASVDCSPEELSLHTSLVEDAKKARTLAYISVGAGTALIGTALYLYLNSAEDSAPRAVRAIPTVAHDGSVGASFDRNLLMRWLASRIRPLLILAAPGAALLATACPVDERQLSSKSWSLRAARIREAVLVEQHELERRSERGGRFRRRRGGDTSAGGEGGTPGSGGTGGAGGSSGAGGSMSSGGNGAAAGLGGGGNGGTGGSAGGVGGSAGTTGSGGGGNGGSGGRRGLPGGPEREQCGRLRRDAAGECGVRRRREQLGYRVLQHESLGLDQRHGEPRLGLDLHHQYAVRREWSGGDGAGSDTVRGRSGREDLPARGARFHSDGADRRGGEDRGPLLRFGELYRHYRVASVQRCALHQSDRHVDSPAFVAHAAGRNAVGLAPAVRHQAVQSNVRDRQVRQLALHDAVKRVWAPRRRSISPRHALSPQDP